VRIVPKTVTEPATEPVTLSQLRSHVRVDDNSDDAMLLGYLIAARAHVENLLGRPIVPRTVRATFESWGCPAWAGSLWVSGYAVPSRTRLDLLVPVTSVDAITYTDLTQTQVPWTGFIARTSNGGTTSVRPAYGTDWPVLGLDPVITLDATSGFASVPEPIVQAILLMAGHLYLNREEVLTGSRITAIQLPLGVADLIMKYRWQWFG
jgi:uncharacterized phiE125 gp8 family phage protein